ncbi:hypothetical protein H6P81_014428 [Aristolochia fimbriata]|uniref:Uncharacterized protein n=1 Tax=Aristolochia fimbriata TaxID=158543 RepID=A0AAV7EJL8_ARIFI|nr:hypothetical protein H6P81_014428 [Aristolochia fimbriata]
MRPVECGKKTEGLLVEPGPSDPEMGRGRATCAPATHSCTTSASQRVFLLYETWTVDLPPHHTCPPPICRRSRGCSPEVEVTWQPPAAVPWDYLKSDPDPSDFSSDASDSSVSSSDASDSSVSSSDASDASDAPEFRPGTLKTSDVDAIAEEEGPTKGKIRTVGVVGPVPALIESPRFVPFDKNVTGVTPDHGSVRRPDDGERRWRNVKVKSDEELFGFLFLIRCYFEGESESDLARDCRQDLELKIAICETGNWTREGSLIKRNRNVPPQLGVRSITWKAATSLVNLWGLLDQSSGHKGPIRQRTRVREEPPIFPTCTTWLLRIDDCSYSSVRKRSR